MFFYAFDVSVVSQALVAKVIGALKAAGPGVIVRLSAPELEAWRKGVLQLALPNTCVFLCNGDAVPEEVTEKLPELPLTPGAQVWVSHEYFEYLRDHFHPFELVRMDESAIEKPTLEEVADLGGQKN